MAVDDRQGRKSVAKALRAADGERPSARRVAVDARRHRGHLERTGERSHCPAGAIGRDVRRRRDKQCAVDLQCGNRQLRQLREGTVTAPDFIDDQRGTARPQPAEHAVRPGNTRERTLRDPQFQLPGRERQGTKHLRAVAFELAGPHMLAQGTEGQLDSEATARADCRRVAGEARQRRPGHRNREPGGVCDRQELGWRDLAAQRMNPAHVGLHRHQFAGLEIVARQVAQHELRLGQRATQFALDVEAGHREHAQRIRVELKRAAQPMIFQHLGVNEGLPQNTVNATLQDSQGFIWVATEDGLVRYDGYETRHYAVERGKPGSLPGNYVWAMAEDRAGDLWLVIKNGGLVRWSRSTERFTTFRHDPARPDASPASDAIRQLLIDRRGHIWLATTGSGLDDFDPATGKFKHYRHDAGRPDSLSSDVVTTLWQTPEGALWVGTDNGLNHWLPAADGFLSFHHDPRDVHSLSSNGITAISVDRRGRLWVGTYNNGINVGDKDGSRFTGYRHKPKDARSLPDDEVRAVLEDRDGRVWIGTAAGLALFDEQAGGFDIYTRDSAEPTSLRDNYVMSLLEDHAGLLWVGTRAGGVSRWDPHTWLLGHQKPAGLANDYVNAFAEDRQGRIWVGTREGLVRFDAATGNWTPFERVRLSGASLGDRRIMSLLTDRNGNLWIGTMTAGLYRLSPEGAVRVWRAARGHPQALAADGIMALCEDSRGRLWIGTFGGGVSILDPATDRFQNLAYDPKDPGSLGAPNATAIIEDGGGNIWVGSDGGGLNIIRPDGTVAALFRHQPDQADSLSANSIYALQRDATGRLWVGTDGGGIDLVIGSSAKPSAVRFKPVTQQQGLSSNVVYGIRSDGQRGLWLSGNSGLMRYDPETGAVRQFHREQGLQGEEFNFGAHYRTRDGRLLFGGANGFNMIAPEHLQARNAPPTPVLTGVQIMNHPAALATPYPLLASLNLKHAESVVSFDFSALDYSAPDKIRYAYRLRGFDPDFIELRQGHSVSYTNLDAGTYLLELKAGNSDGAWSRSVLPRFNQSSQQWLCWQSVARH